MIYAIMKVRIFWNASVKMCKSLRVWLFSLFSSKVFKKGKKAKNKVTLFFTKGILFQRDLMYAIEEVQGRCRWTEKYVRKQPCCTGSCWYQGWFDLGLGNAASGKLECFQLYLLAILSYLHQPWSPWLFPMMILG